MAVYLSTNVELNRQANVFCISSICYVLIAANTKLTISHHAKSNYLYHYLYNRLQDSLIYIEMLLTLLENVMWIKINILALARYDKQKLSN